MTAADAPVLALTGGTVTVRGEDGVTLELISDISLALHREEILGLVGESGCGKSTTARAMLALLPLSRGELTLHGSAVRRDHRPLRSSVQAIFQNPIASFNPKRSLLDSVAEPLRVHGEGDRAERDRRALAELERVGLSEHVARQRPRDVSGGQCQRAAIARATILRPEALICDEPVSALDVSIQAQIIELLAELRRDLGIAMLFISHDLSVVASLCDRTAVMYAGRLVEEGPTMAVARDASHPYTVILHDSEPADPAGPATTPRLPVVEHADDVEGRLLPGCRFASLCPRVTEVCTSRPPELEEVDPGHRVACFHPLAMGVPEAAPPVEVS
jgi:oligopeptide/dipeptide ABC transporter ATP-binding protein